MSAEQTAEKKFKALRGDFTRYQRKIKSYRLLVQPKIYCCSSWQVWVLSVAKICIFFVAGSSFSKVPSIETYLLPRAIAYLTRRSYLQTSRRNWKLPLKAAKSKKKKGENSIVFFFVVYVFFFVFLESNEKHIKTRKGYMETRLNNTLNQ